jgi:hypothetical protein
VKKMRPPFLPGTIPIVCPLCITRMAAPGRALQRAWARGGMHSCKRWDGPVPESSHRNGWQLGQRGRRHDCHFWHLSVSRIKRTLDFSTRPFLNTLMLPMTLNFG